MNKGSPNLQYMYYCFSACLSHAALPFVTVAEHETSCNMGLLAECARILSNNGQLVFLLPLKECFHPKRNVFHELTTLLTALVSLLAAALTLFHHLHHLKLDQVRN